MSDHHLCATLSVVWFILNTMYSISGECACFLALSVADITAADTTGSSANEQVQILALVVAAGVMQKYVAATLCYVPFTVVAAATIVHIIPQVIFFLDTNHPGVLGFQVFLIFVKLTPALGVYGFGLCFNAQFANTKRIPTDNELKDLIVTHYTSGWSRERVLFVIVITLAVSLNVAMLYTSGQQPSFFLVLSADMSYYLNSSGR